MSKRTVFTLYLFLVSFYTAEADSLVQRVRLPDGGEIPEAIVDAEGKLHVMYGIKQDALYVNSDDNGQTFSTPVRINRREGTVTVGGERGPKFCLGQNGAIHVVWLGHYKLGGGVWYTRSLDGGVSFETERNLQDVQTGGDSPTVIADSEGTVIAHWLDGRVEEDPNSPVASPIFTCRSTDNGQTFSTDEPVLHNHPGRACACCRLVSRIGPDGMVYLSFRSGYKGIRDMFILRGEKNDAEMDAFSVSEDNWVMNACPMVGSPFVFFNEKIFVPWMSKQRVYWSYADLDDLKFLPRMATPEPMKMETYPSILVNSKEQILLVWKQERNVRWALYNTEGKPTGEEGTVGELKGMAKPAAFLGKNDRFYIVF